MTHNDLAEEKRLNDQFQALIQEPLIQRIIATNPAAAQGLVDLLRLAFTVGVKAGAEMAATQAQQLMEEIALDLTTPTQHAH